MTHDFERTHLWKSSLAKRAEADEHEVARDRLRGAYLKFRDRVSHLVSTIKSELPGLTVHDITHLDALWRVASEIAGPTYELTPAEAFVLGGAILLHDSAHAIAAFPGGKAEIKQTQHWRDLIAQRYNRQDPAAGSDDERAALFQVLRHLHATQAAKLPFVKWTVPGDDTPNFLIEDAELRNYYGELIGRIAESHHWPAHRVATEFSHQNHTPPSYLPTEWTVDAMKLAFLLRTADAAHIDDARAPWFLFALQKPEGLSESHWRFQSKFGQPRCTSFGELQLSTASSFGIDERDAWWLAYETAQMIDRELRDAHGLMRDHDRALFSASSVLGATSADSFARYVRPQGWEPIDVSPKIGNVGRIIEMLGGDKLYGDHPEYALRELLQNAIDAVQAKRSLGGLRSEEGEIVVTLERLDEERYRLSVSDNGIGMSKYVLTNVLIDFGHSLWTSDALREHLPGIAESGFTSAGQFGIGFFSAFMLTRKVSVESRAAYSGECTYRLTFDRGLNKRPILSEASLNGASGATGTRVDLVVSESTLDHILTRGVHPHYGLDSTQHLAIGNIKSKKESIIHKRLENVVALLAPCSPVDIRIVSAARSSRAIAANDWRTISGEHLLARTTAHRELDLLPLFDLTGLIVGRVGVDTPWADLPGLLLTHKGTLCGFASAFLGVYEIPSPSNAARTSAVARSNEIPLWKDWANRYLDAFEHLLNEDQLMLMHAIVPERDLPVYQLAGEWVTLDFLEAYISERSEIAVFDGILAVERQEILSADDLETYFIQDDACVLLPKMNRFRRDFLSIPNVSLPSYVTIVSASAKAKWSGVKTRVVEDFTVGSVLGKQILRQVTLLSKAR